MGDLQRELDSIALNHDQSLGFTPSLIQCRANLLNQFPPGSVLDFGCADGLLTLELARHHQKVVAVDASEVRIKRARERTRDQDNVFFSHSTFELFQSEETFDLIVLSCILEHLEDPAATLRHASKFLAPEGRLVAIVPHAGSLHRRAGVYMGMLETIDSANEEDEKLDHDRIYTRPLLRQHIKEAGLELKTDGGYLLKPFPNHRMTEIEAPLLAAFEKLGADFPDLSAEIYAIGVLGDTD